MTHMRPIFVRGLEFLALAMAVLASLCMVGIVGVIVAGVVMRRFANAPLHITEDVVGLMLSAALFLALPLVTLRAQHVRVAIVANALQRRFATAVHVGAMLVGLFFFGWIFMKALPWLEFAWGRNLKSETARLLLYPWMAVLPLSMAVIWMIFAARLTGLLERERHASLEELPDIATAEEDR
ncbi:MAG: TRAP transporter small permease [Pseudorhodobacter sp.]